jgi:hypothetical protein
MATGISAFGERGISGVFGWENNELHRKVYLADPANQLMALLQELFGNNPGDDPIQFPAPFTSFRAWTVSFDTTSDKGSQGETESTGTFTMLSNFPTVRGGVTLDITYRPLDTQSTNYVSDEAWDFSAQVMSLIGNNFGQNPNNLTWSDGTPITNLTSIIKIIPKIEFLQKQVFVADLPNQTQINLIGQINDGTLFAGASGGDQKNQWPEGTVLLTGLPAVRRWRFDGQQIFEVGPKFAINMYQDQLEDGSTGYVTWNRLYRPTKGYWDTVQVGPNQSPMYISGDLSQVV